MRPDRGAGPQRAEEVALGRAFLRRHPTVDLHSHPGRFFMAGSPETAELATRFPPAEVGEAVLGITEHGPTAVAFATVGDYAVLGGGPQGIEARRPFTGTEAYDDHLRQLAVLDAVISGSDLRPVSCAAGIREAHWNGHPVALTTVEGGDFIESDPGRIGEARTRGVRSITLVHFRPNRIGTPQTIEGGAGLSAFGADVVREMNRCGVLIDLSHADFSTTEQAVETSGKPCVLSHSNVWFGGARHRRLVSGDHARLVTSAGGVVGAVPAGYAQATFGDYIDTVLRMIDLLGAEHVAIGTDMDFTYQPVLDGYQAWPAIPGALLARGVSEPEAALVLGGNVLRLLDETNPIPAG
ncbi:MAG TPA: membrane dipeptidase [Amycolatopsis sp.]|jgi:membrane dipeptidase